MKKAVCCCYNRRHWYCGKSTAAKILQEAGAVVINTDLTRKELMANHGGIREKIFKEFGARGVHYDGLN